MDIFMALPVLAADIGELSDRWRDLGPAVWAVAGGLAVSWVAVLGLLTVLTDPRRVAAGPATLQPPGTEHPAIVNLITNDWELGHEAVAATLVDLAARRHLDIDLVGERALLRVRTDPAGLRSEADVAPYERMVLDHVHALAGRTDGGVVPAGALTTGTEASAGHWWQNFRSAVVADARARGLSRPRWSRRLKSVMVTIALPVALAVGLAASTVPDDPDDPDDNPATTALAVGAATFLGLSAVAGSRTGERDTPAGRMAAARWLGLRDLLDEDPLFAEQPPAAVTIWGRLLAHGTALGVAHGVVDALPLGSESQREAWSTVGGRWRLVRIRYPRWLPPGYGRHPALVALVGLLLLAIGVPLLPAVQHAASALLDTFGDGALDGGLGTEVPAGFRVGVLVVLAIVAVMATALALCGAAMAFVGLSDLLTGRTTVEGQVLRVRDRGTDGGIIRYLAVDDGSADRVRAWRFRRSVPGDPGTTVRGDVTRRLRHVARLEVVGGRDADESTAAAAPAAAGAAAVPPPPLPGDEEISAATGLPLVRDTGAAPHPAGLPGGSALYRGTGGTHIQLVWVAPATAGGHLHAVVGRGLGGPGGESVRVVRGGVVARTGDRLLIVVPHLPGLDPSARDEIAVRAAGVALDRADHGARRTTGTSGEGGPDPVT